MKEIIHTMSTKKFKTEVNDLLNLIIHSLYSHPEIFLRELVSNASDALDKLKYLTISDDAFKSLKFEPKISIDISDEEKKFIVISDSGIGMSKEDLESSLGTIARSGTKRFMEEIGKDKLKDSNLIGQFGVGFYSVFMVADKVEVTSRKAGSDAAWTWISDGKAGYSIDEANKEDHGTTIKIFLNEDGKEFHSQWGVQEVIKKYSNHIPYPIELIYQSSRYEGEGDDQKKIDEVKNEIINDSSALWKRSKSELEDEDYKSFYKTLGQDMEDPMLWLHTHAEGTFEYSTLFYIPNKAPQDILRADYASGVKLYVKRVFITDDDKDLLPVYLRFVKGVIDAEDIPLNVSREILQKNKVLASIKKSSTKRILDELKKLSNKDADGYAHFIDEYNRLLKEGLYMDHENKDALLELVRFKSSKVDGYVSLSEYKDRMQEDQKSIFYITGENEQALRNSALLEIYNKKDIEVLIMDTDIDEVVVPSIGTYKESSFMSVNTSGSADELKNDEEKEQESKEENVSLLNSMKEILADNVKNVVASNRLVDSPACIVIDSNDPTAQMQQMLKAMGQPALDEIKPILEINLNHDIVKKLIDMKQEDELFKDVSFLLFEQSLLNEGLEVKSRAEFASRLNKVLSLAL